MRLYFRIFALYLMLTCIGFILFHIRLQKVDEDMYLGHETHSTNYMKIDQTETKSNIPLLYSRRNMSFFSERDRKNTYNRKWILFYNLPDYMRDFLRKDLLYENCDYQNCIFTRSKTNLFTADAIIFYIGIKNERLGIEPPIHREQRNQNQTWIFTSVEPPEHYYNMDYKSISWQSTMNWSSLYRLDSDIPNPYGTLVSQTNSNQLDYKYVYKTKTKNALWIVSHCQVASERRLYVSEMVKHGFDVDIYGGCSSDGRKLSQNELEVIIPTYKFFLAFENSFCVDYISEKFFQNYNMSWIIVVRGGANYSHLLPYKTFINTADFANVSSLVHYLFNIANDQETYVEFLKYKDRYISIRWPGNRNCEICRRLNNLSNFRKTYKTVADYLSKGQCKRPDDM